MQKTKETGIPGEFRTSNIRMTDATENSRRPTTPNTTNNLLLALFGSVSAYRGETFDAAQSKSRVGILGELARAMPGFTRTVHPVYSTSCWGKDVQTLARHDPHTCFGPGSFFDLFAQLSDPYIVMLGTNLSAVTLAHYYDQMFNARGRFLKVFRATIVCNNEPVEIEFDSFVKDHEFYGDRMPCLGRLDVLAEQFGLIEREECLGNWCHGIREQDLRRLYHACLKVDPEYFLVSSREEFKDYYEKNQFRLFVGGISPDRLEAVRANLG